MACCVLVAALIAQLITLWKSRGRRALWMGGVMASLILLGWQTALHWPHFVALTADLVAIEGTLATHPHHEH